MNISFRPAEAEDEDFLFDLHRQSMRAYIEETFGVWDEGWQRDYFHQHFHPQALQIIQVDGQDGGVLYLQERTEEFFIAGIEILPAYQRRGIGSTVIRGVIAEATRQGKPVALKVLKSNRAARSLYQRLGFGVTGETDTHYLLAYYQSR
jgi:ribosomal protein S18 acetylase RimI-like enzyme